LIDKRRELKNFLMAVEGGWIEKRSLTVTYEEILGWLAERRAGRRSGPPASEPESSPKDVSGFFFLRKKNFGIETLVLFFCTKEIFFLRLE
jgi:hypothetical protein